MKKTKDQKRYKKLIKFKYKPVSEKLKVLQLPNNSIQEEIITLMKGKEEFIDKTDNGDLLYTGDIFNEIKQDHKDADDKILLPKKVINQLDELIILCENYQYVMIIDNPK